MANAPDNSKPKSSALTMIVGVLLLTLIAAGAGLGVGVMLAPAPGAEQLAEATVAETAPDTGHAAPKKETADHGAPAADPHGAAPDAAVIAAFEVPVPVPIEEPMIVVPLEPIITNLAAPQGVWLRIEASLLASAGHAHAPQAMAAEMAAAMLAYIRTLKLSDIEGNSGFLAFRDDLDDLVMIASHGAARQVLVKSLVVE
jgi:flagellar FliL protein